MATYKFVTIDNLRTFLAKIKNYFSSELAKLSYTPSNNEGKFVKSVSQSNGQIAVTYNEIEISDVKDLDTRLTTLDGAITQAGTNATVTVEALTTPSNGMFKSYAIKQNGTQVGVTIDIPKDFLVKSGVITDGTGNNLGKKVLKLTINAKDGSDEAQDIEIPVNDLCDVYTAGDGLQEANNKFSVKIKSGTENDVIRLSATTADGLSVSYTKGTVASNNTGLVTGGDVYTSQQSLVSDINDLKSKVGDTSTQIIEAINALDVDSKGGEGQFIQSISQVDGKISATAVEFSTIFTACDDSEIEALFTA